MPLPKNRMTRQELNSIMEAAKTLLEAKKESMTGRGEDQESLEGLMRKWYPDIAFWKIYNAMRILKFFQEFEQQLGEEQFQQKPLWIQLADLNYTLTTLYVFTEQRYQRAPILKIIVNILEGKEHYASLNQLETAILSWFKEKGVSLEDPKPRIKKNVQPPTEKSIETKETRTPEKDINSGRIEKISKLDAIGMFHAAEEIIKLQDNKEIVPPMTLQGYMEKQYSQYSVQQIFQAMRIVRMLTPFEEQIGEVFQFAERRIYLQLLDRDLAMSTIYSFTKQRFQAAPIKDILKGILTGKIQLSGLTQVEKYLEEQSLLVVNASPVPLTIIEEEQEDDSEETQLEDLENEVEPQSTMETLLDHTLPWNPRPFPLPTRFPLQLVETVDGNRKAITRGNFQLTEDNLEHMRIYLVAQGSNGVLLVSNRFVYRSKDHHNRPTVDRSEEENNERVNERLHNMKIELEKLFKQAYPNKTKRGDYPRILSFQEIYAQSRSSILTYLQQKHYYVITLHPPKVQHEKGQRGRPKRVDNTIFLNQ